MIIRSLTPDEAGALRQLRSVVDVEGNLGSEEECQLALELEHLWGQLIEPAETVGAFSDRHELIGAATLAPMPACPIDPEVWFAITGVMVHPDHRRQQTGATLLDECLVRARQLNAVGVLLDVNVPNPAAIALYQSRGFVKRDMPQKGHIHRGRTFETVSMRLHFGASSSVPKDCTHG